MKLILMTLPHFFIEEHQILTALFDEGLETLHLRKPDTEPVYSERLLSLLPEEYRKNIVVHDHFYLKNEYGL
jgi:thiamine-phosphate pyrophosphorylase